MHLLAFPILALTVGTVAMAQQTNNHTYCGDERNPSPTSFIGQCLAAQRTQSCTGLQYGCSDGFGAGGIGICESCAAYVPILAAPMTRLAPVWSLLSLGFRDEVVAKFDQICAQACLKIGQAASSTEVLNKAVGVCACGLDSNLAPELGFMLPRASGGWDRQWADTVNRSLAPINLDQPHSDDPASNSTGTPTTGSGGSRSPSAATGSSSPKVPGLPTTTATADASTKSAADGHVSGVISAGVAGLAALVIAMA
ncbi:hypothetical protein HKX48_002525 [Thoreauomyces humboldtii]|nr:hypothetical protein HKX48_002525 [Thoreauomyces humboldtii]